MEEEVTEQFASRAVRRFVLLRCGNDLEIGPGRLRAFRHFDQAG
jgi:hypothetical protein